VKIAYVGNRTNLDNNDKSFNTENHIALTLELLGHTVDFIQEKDEDNQNTLVNRVKGSDLFLYTRTWGKYVTKEDLRAIEALGIPTVSFHLDLYSNIARDGDMDIRSPFWDTQYIFSPENSVQARKVFKEHNINQFYLPPGVYEPECYIAESVDRYKHDVVFIGGGSSYGHPEWQFYRHKLMMFLDKTYGDRFGKYGGAEGLVRGHELNLLLSSAKIVIGDSLNKDFIDSYYYSDRIFETTGRGGFTISPYIPGITDHFVDRKEAVFYAYDNFVQLENLINYYLENDEEREAIRLAGHERTKRENTYTNRMKIMINTLVQEGAFE
jgi:hypothetical protein